MKTYISATAVLINNQMIGKHVLPVVAYDVREAVSQTHIQVAALYHGHATMSMLVVYVGPDCLAARELAEEALNDFFLQNLPAALDTAPSGALVAVPSDDEDEDDE
jgi:hypothetical protein